MAECFEGLDGVVRFSNGAVELLYQAWCRLGEGAARTEEERAVLAWLRRTLDHGAAGGRAFPLNPAPIELAAPERMRFLAQLTATLAKEVIQPESAVLPNIDWDQQLRISWLARLMDLHELIQRASPVAAAEPNLEKQLAFPEKLRAEVQAERLVSKLGELSRPQSTVPASARLAVMDEIISVLHKGGLEEEKRELLARLHNQRADVLLKLKNIPGAIAALRSASVYESDPELRATNAEYAAELEQELPRK